ncbi:MAG: YggS family pyridoxal phosphate-dependent enzyme [Methylococcales bacterium]|nr:MAG: YggS family pyridoxal phosphate-dependent enzyme [Methylococcales bacterium]
MVNNKLNTLLTRIRQAEIAYHRTPLSVQLLAVSKTKTANNIAQLYSAGQRHFGENYCQEALKKQQELGAYDITWHFIGPIQSNKTKLIANHFSWVHSVDSLKIAQRLSEQRPSYLPPLTICLQVNISGEQSKSGISLDELPDLCEQVAELPNIKLRGVMAIPEPENSFEKQRQPFKTLYQTVEKLPTSILLDTYSFGMSGDLEAAIAEGATIVRIGTALFGARYLM